MNNHSALAQQPSYSYTYSERITEPDWNSDFPVNNDLPVSEHVPPEMPIYPPNQFPTWDDLTSSRMHVFS